MSAVLSQGHQPSERYCAGALGSHVLIVKNSVILHSFYLIHVHIGLGDIIHFISTHLVPLSFGGPNWKQGGLCF